MPSSTWDFHGTDVRRFIEKEMGPLAAIAVEFTKLSNVTPESMQEVIGVDSKGVISDVREFGRALTADELASRYQWRSGGEPLCRDLGCLE